VGEILKAICVLQGHCAMPISIVCLPGAFVIPIFFFANFSKFHAIF